MNRILRYIDLQRNKTAAAFSLVEMLVVIGIVAILVALSIPAINTMQKSFDSTGAESMISTVLATARTLAISKGQYAGVRFQTAYDVNNVLNADQYMIFIMEDDTTWTCGFSAVEGYKPIKLPSNIGVIDKIIWRNRPIGATCQSTPDTDALLATDLDDSNPANLDPDGNNRNITDTSTFSIAFSPAGKLVTYKLRCGRDDDIFNTKTKVEADPPTGMFIQDANDAFGIGVEDSRKSFVIYDRDKFRKMTTSQQRFDYLKALEVRYINAYTGEIIKN